MSEIAFWLGCCGIGIFGGWCLGWASAHRDHADMFDEGVRTGYKLGVAYKQAKDQGKD